MLLFLCIIIQGNSTSAIFSKKSVVSFLKVNLFKPCPLINLDIGRVANRMGDVMDWAVTTPTYVFVSSLQKSLMEAFGADKYADARKEVLTNMFSRPMQVSGIGVSSHSFQQSLLPSLQIFLMKLILWFWSQWSQAMAAVLRLYSKRKEVCVSSSRRALRRSKPGVKHGCLTPWKMLATVSISFMLDTDDV